ncbi:hypothetical protein [Acinetobacter guillouiae]|uniref:hypothetical protein n=1 Tax=Acinetobacter guillouiae TaxID=106649 RepID=UPI003C6FD383
MKFIFIIISVVSISACVTFPKNSVELESQSKSRYEFNIPRDLSKVEESFDTYMNKCHDSKKQLTIYLNHARIGPEMGFDKIKEDGRVKYYPYYGGELSSKKYIWSFDLSIDGANDNVTNVKIGTLNKLWESTLNNFKKIANGESTSC